MAAGLTLTTGALTAEGGRTARHTDTGSAPDPRAKANTRVLGTLGSKYREFTLGPGRITYIFIIFTHYFVFYWLQKKLFNKVSKALSESPYKDCVWCLTKYLRWYCLSLDKVLLHLMNEVYLKPNTND